ncbi:ubiquitin-conjugating enzyme E2 J2-like isoform X2 [Formica exsecta]|uniref:ubiquitin-conjugating enzyme E2 J2-like isoform X2 n=1 Tax=Formica exsecta TaxID=72781 RepID=UPI001142BF88|nr:ubiquitin-conjugating enzyme E2 J2-like isoform X2 [Formica exsecta]
MDKESNSAIPRLRQDYLHLKMDPVPYILAEPVPTNLLEWHYVVRGPESTPYEGGYYHGKILFPEEFPFKPPSIYMSTPNGRFCINARLCLSISDYHPETWNPAWNMEKTPTLGSINTTDYEKRQLAMQSLEYNLKDKLFCELFPETVEAIKTELEHRKEKRLDESR